MVLPLWTEWRKASEPTRAQSDKGLGTSKIATIPRYAFDGNTRTGRRYLYWLAKQSPELGQYLTNVIVRTDQNALLRKLYFRTNSSLCADRQVWDVADKVRQRADQIGFGLTAAMINEGKQILKLALNQYPMTEKHL